MKPALVACGLLLICAACSAPIATDAGPAAAAFNLDLVKTNYRVECVDPMVVDQLFCQQVKIDAMTGDGTILNVPTGLNAAAGDRAQVICEAVARAHFDGATGDDLGYQTVGILDMNGGYAAACSVLGP